MASTLTDITRKRRKEMGETESQARTDIQLAYDRVLSGLQRDLSDLVRQIDEAKANGETVNPDWLRRQWRYQRLIDQALGEFGRWSDGAISTVSKGQEKAIALGSGIARETWDAVGGDVSMFRGQINTPALVEYVASLSEGGPVRDVFQSFGDEAGAYISDTILRGLASGKGANAIRNEIMKGLGDWSNKRRVGTIVRTELMRSFNASLAEQYGQVSHLIKGYRWTAALSTRTCLACLGMHNRMFDKYQSRFHVNCRCICVPVPKGSTLVPLDADAWMRRQPGFKVIEMFPTPDAWLAWQGGKVGLGDFVGTKSNKTWGESVYERSWRSVAKANGLPYRTEEGRRWREARSIANISDPKRQAAARADFERRWGYSHDNYSQPPSANDLYTVKEAA